MSSVKRQILFRGFVALLLLSMQVQGEQHHRGFRFGSYGRIGVGTTGEGKAVTGYDFVSHSPRLFEYPYIELDLGYFLSANEDSYVKVLATTAIISQLFHYTGIPSDSIAIRNLYLELKGYPVKWLSLWVGSRMYRGDDIYLVDYWPMDNLNTIGGGVILTPGTWEFKVHLGINRLKDEFQYQEIEVAGEGFSPVTVIFMNRQRFISSAKATRFFLFETGKWNKGAKVSLYGEFHYLANGYRYREEEPPEHLPSDIGWLAGLQGGLWGVIPDSFVNLWLKVAGGLAAYGEMAVPFGLDKDKKTSGAAEFVAGLSGNLELPVMGTMIGGYLRYFRDADPNVYDIHDYWESVVVARLQFYITKMIHLALEVGESLKRMTAYPSQTPVYVERMGRFNKVNFCIPSVTHVAGMFIVSPFGKGTYTRPQIRVVSALQAPNKCACSLYPKEDIRSGGDRWNENLLWYFSLQAEWWFNSSYR